MKSPQISKPVRASHTYVQNLVASAKDVFPLLCPVRELEWVKGWPLTACYSNSGLAENDCVFITESSGRSVVWMITQYDVDNTFIEMIRINPEETACRLQIQLKEILHDSCSASISYTHTALCPDGEKFVEKYTAEYFADFMKDWEDALNKFLSER